MTESELQKKCTEYLDKLGIPWYHIPNGQWKMRNQNRADWPDLFIFLDGGRTIFVELKTKVGKLSEGQIEKLEVLRARNYDCYVIDDFQNFFNLINSKK